MRTTSPDGTQAWIDAGRVWLRAPTDAAPFMLPLPADVTPTALAFDSEGEAHVAGLRAAPDGPAPVWLHAAPSGLAPMTLPLTPPQADELRALTGTPRPTALSVDGLPLVVGFSGARLDAPRRGVVVFADARAAQRVIFDEADVVAALRTPFGGLAVLDDARWAAASGAREPARIGDWRRAVRAALGTQRGQIVVTGAALSADGLQLEVALEDPTEHDEPLLTATLRAEGPDFERFVAVRRAPGARAS
jgi:hypothetical protein